MAALRQDPCPSQKDRLQPSCVTTNCSIQCDMHSYHQPQKDEGIVNQNNVIDSPDVCVNIHWTDTHPPFNVERNTVAVASCNTSACMTSLRCDAQNTVFQCGACLHVFDTVCVLHVHLLKHGCDGSYVYDNNTRVAYPKYNSICQSSQTDCQDWMDDSKVLGRSSAESSDKYHSAVDSSLEEFIRTDPGCIEQIMDEVLDDANDITDEDDECPTEGMEGELEHQIVQNEDDTNSILYDELSLCMKEIEEHSTFVKTKQIINNVRDCSVDWTKDDGMKGKKHCENKRTEEQFAEDSRGEDNISGMNADVLIADRNKTSARIRNCGSETSVKQHKPAKRKKHVELRCDLCGKMLVSKAGLSRHALIHSGQHPFSCSVCNRAFRTTGELNTHKQSHSDSKNFICQSCGRTFPAANLLRLHITSCLDIRPFSCSHIGCGKAFRGKSTLEIHARSHTGELPFICEYCGKAFARADMLSKHNFIHTGDKPCECEVCHKTFTTKDHLKRHTRMHTKDKPYKCPHCGKCFSQRWNLTGHLRQHTGDKPYSCDVCGRRFKHNVSRRRHMAKDHSNTAATDSH